jgi:hypothetical protein
MGVAKQALAPKHTAMIKGLGLTPSMVAVEMAIGSIRMAVALLLKICVLILVNRMSPLKTIIGLSPWKRLK